ncbi:hypothetical protein [Erythrobacter donghaensis]|uniref:hypothetical protein n=1 Tax=Erythrobacter donghaensis TaxID=267135 RepID=UPI000939C4E5|nr:hypothetical protein [Erythrobacter donghaensis]
MNSTTSSTGAPERPAFRFHPRLWIAAALLLALPAVAMQVTSEVNWGPEDFAVAGLMLLVLCAALEGAMNYLTALRWRVSAMTLAVLMFLTLWAHLAVGLFD